MILQHTPFMVSVLLFSTLPLLAAQPLADRPNIVLFIADDHTATDCGAYGSREVRTPNLDRLASEGLRFNRAFAGSPVCIPSRAVIYTGLMPLRNGAHANHVPGASALRDGTLTLPHFLSGLGYRVAHAGKRHYSPEILYPFERIPNSEAPEPGYDAAPALRMDLQVEVVEAWLVEAAKARDQPFCLIVCDHSPHVIWPEQAEYDPEAITVPPHHIDTPELRIARSRYYTDITKMDRNVGRVLAALDRNGFTGNTLFIYTADQGAQWPFAKWSLYDEGIRVPLIMRWPGRLPPETESDAMVSLADLLPTFIELAGGQPPLDLDGRSLRPLFSGETHAHRHAIFASYSQDGIRNLTPMRCVRTDRFKYILNLTANRYTTHMDSSGSRDGERDYWPSWRRVAERDSRAARVLQRYHERPSEELYDLLVDPLELHNLADDAAYADIRIDLAGQLRAWRKAQGDTKTAPDPVPPRRTDPSKSPKRNVSA
jgi:N-sulfoglucosamine sulfohydrolase